MNSPTLKVGFGEVDITPPVGLQMAGSLTPRGNEGIDDPLMMKAIVLADDDRSAAIVGVDLISLPSHIVEPALDEATRRTGIGRDCIIVSCSHTHSGPYTGRTRSEQKQLSDDAYLSTLPEAIATSVECAYQTLQPATMHIGRSIVHQYLHNRRVLGKDGKAINTWMRDLLGDLEKTPQLLGAAGPIDPEMWVVRFDDADGVPFGAFVNFTLHVNMHFGRRYSADYPGVIAAEMRHIFGPAFYTVFTPGACANINTTAGGPIHWRHTADYFAEQAIQAARSAIPIEGATTVDGARQDVLAQRRDVESQRDGAVERLNWGGGKTYSDVFQRRSHYVESLPDQVSVPVNAVRFGPFAVASNPGELFVEHGLTIKRRSPFPHTVVAELSNASIAYQPTGQAFEEEGYETLVGANLLSVGGIEQVVDAAVELLDALWERGDGDKGE
jgi:hypothetical protein